MTHAQAPMTSVGNDEGRITNDELQSGVSRLHEGGAVWHGRSCPAVSSARPLRLCVSVGVALVVATGVIGTALARSQGWRVWSRIREELAAGRMPAEPLLDAVLILFAGALLLTPGVLTDLLGITLLIPWTRNYYRRRLVAWFKSHFTIQTPDFRSWPPSQAHSKVVDSYVIGQEEKKNAANGGR